MPTRLSVNVFLKEAIALDAAGREFEAIAIYRRAIARGITGKNLRAALIGLGSSLRTVGQFAASIRTLQRARKLFPGDVAVMLFLALAHYDAGQHPLALRQLGDALLEESKQKNLAPYRRVLGRKYHSVR